ncbi:MAG: 2Fe-2S iron-sulfur cluster-binding protein [Treponema sp.]|nr:2Fe-2S iron-sulfur cluster-binding protein [Treponema sp.]
MTIGFILNGEDVVVRTEAEHRLVDILRSIFNLLETKSCCNIGNCGSCSIIFNGDVIKSCLVPAFKIRDSEIITIEGFSQTTEYQDIIEGFSRAKTQACAFCKTGKILATEALLGKNQNPLDEEILSAFSGIRCRCTEPESLIRGVKNAAERRRSRIYGRSF